MNSPENQNICGLILAGGKGTRMQSELPKVLHMIGPKSMLQHVVDNLLSVKLGGICVVIGGELHKFDKFCEQNGDVALCEQKARQGTGDAVASTAPFFRPLKLPAYARGTLLRGNPRTFKSILVCAGDAPAVNPKTLAAFISGAQKAQAKLAVLGMIHPKPTGYGRIICDKAGNLEKIVEEKNASPGEKLVQLCNTGVIFAEKEYLFSCLAQVSPNELSNEYYLTDCFEIARREGEKVYVHQTEDYHEFDGVNDPEQLRQLSEWLRSEGRI